MVYGYDGFYLEVGTLPTQRMKHADDARALAAM